ncbi:MAG: D-glucuronyl C5-epimerase family protein [Candidatus Limnocylindrales bacterium]
MIRTSFIVLVLAALLLPETVLAVDEPLPSPSPATVGAAAADASPGASLLPAELVSVSIGPGTGSAQAMPEPDFLVGEWELQAVPWPKLRLNGGRALPIRTEGPQDADGVPMRPLGPGGRLVYNPTVIAQQGMKRLDSYVQTGQRAHLRHARRHVRVLDELATGGRLRRWQPHDYDLGVHESGWVNSNSHGLVLSFLSRYHAIAEAPERLEAAGRLLAALEQRPQNERWISLVTSGGYLWFEHWPEGRHDHTLNAHINALFGLYDYWRLTDSPLAEQYFLGGARTVRDKLHRFRRKGDLSRYSLGGIKGSLAYHATHIEQLRILALMTGDDWFERQARLFERDERIWRAENRGGGG